MKQVMMVKFDSPKWRKVDEYKVANPFVDVGFRQVKDVVDLRVFDLLNISRINNNRAEEMLLCIYHLLQPDSRIDEGIYNDEIDQYFSYREWKKKHQPLSGVTVRESVKAHICQSNRLGYYLIKRTADASQMAAEIKTLFIRNHIYLHTDSEKDVQVLRERFLEWKNRNACKLNGKY